MVATLQIGRKLVHKQECYWLLYLKPALSITCPMRMGKTGLE